MESVSIYQFAGYNSIYAPFRRTLTSFKKSMRNERQRNRMCVSGQENFSITTSQVWLHHPATHKVIKIHKPLPRRKSGLIQNMVNNKTLLISTGLWLPIGVVSGAHSGLMLWVHLIPITCHYRQYFIQDILSRQPINVLLSLYHRERKESRNKIKFFFFKNIKRGRQKSAWIYIKLGNFSLSIGGQKPILIAKKQ